ncbi:MAG: protein kinase [Planctomycetes bacterium]|nr:protein kinase [Planctomycetota bacterium]
MTANDPFDQTQKNTGKPAEPRPDATLPAQPRKGQSTQAGQSQSGQPQSGQARSGAAAQPGGTQAGPPPKPAAKAIEATAPAPAPAEATASAPKPAGATPQAGQDALLGAEIGGCRIDALLGRGAMGAVYRARQLRLDREVAVKVIRPELLTDERMLKRFEVEARTVGRFNSPHVVMVHDVGFERGVHYLVMEFVKGKNLREHTKLLAGGRLSVAEALPLLRQACKGLEEAQRLKVLHRDIKPDNLMLTERGVLKIADFGIAKPMHDDFSMTLTSELIGTPLYMSPEQCQAAPDLDFRSDMYSLGATFYYLLTGEPPIRASSVYELIQTKTKLENLCLWKALQELDQNHPLSRVIERMTALSRDDRYPSYEALLTDLALVEQGRTMEIQRTARGGTRVPARAGRGGLLAAAALLLVAAGGGYAWWAGQAGGGGNGSAAAPAASLAALRARLADTGPSPALRDEVAAGAFAAAEQPEQQALLAELDQGLLVKQRLAGLATAVAVEPPFAALREHLQQVEAAVATANPPGPELLRWLSGVRTAARAEAEFGARGVASLVKAFAAWQNDRLVAGGDPARLAALGQRLDGIEAGRSALIELLPATAESLDRDLAKDELQKARNSLRGGDVVPVVVDVSQALDEVQRQFESEGPMASLEQRLKELRPTQPEQLDRKAALLDSLQRAASAIALARGMRSTYPNEPQLPFDDIAGYFAAVDRELAPLAATGSPLPGWAEAVRGELRDDTALGAKALLRCQKAWSDWRAAAAGQHSPADLERLRRGLQRGGELFPALAAQFAAVVGPGELEAAATELGRIGQVQALVQKAAELARRLERLTTLLDWRAAKSALEADFGAATAAAAGFAGEDALRGELRAVETALRRWRDAEAAVVAIAKGLGDGDLAGAVAAGAKVPSGSEGRDEFQVFAAAAAGARDAFAVFDRELDVDQALTLLSGAAQTLRPFAALEPRAGERIERWNRSLRDVQAAAQGMAPVAAGRTKAGVEVSAFFVGRTEVRQREYRQFLDELQQLVATAAAPEAVAATLAPRLGELVLPADVLQRMLSRRTKVAENDLPVEDVSWYEAAAFAVWRRQALPTKDEWELAAFGDRPRHDYPWGDEWKDQAEFRNIKAVAVEVDAGGRSWRAGVHHLAGNVAEWLAVAPNATEAQLAGGSYRDNEVPRDAKRRAAGDEFGRASLKKSLPGFGMRTVLRPHGLLAKDFAGGRYPAAR